MKKAVEKLLNESKGKLEKVKKELKKDKDRLQKINDDKNKRSSFDLELKGVLLKLGQNNIELEAVRIAESKLEKLKDVDKSLSATEENIKTLTDDISKLKFEKDAYDSYMLIKPQLSTTTHDETIDFIENQIENMRSIDNCPSGNDCPYVKKATETLIELTQELTTVMGKREKEIKIHNEWHDGLSLFKEPGTETERLNDVLNKLKEERMKLIRDKADKETYKGIVSKKDELSLEESDLLVKQKKLEDDIRKETEETDNTDVDFLNNKIDKKEDEVLTLTSHVSRYEMKLNAAIKDKETIDKQKDRLKKIKTKEIPELEEKIRKVELVKEAFGSNGIRSVVIDYMLPKLEDNINEILSRLSEFQVRLDTQSEKTSGEGMKEGLFITIINDMGEELPYEAYSGGEKLKITVAISEALAGLQKVGFRAFDELFLGLDSDSTESFAMVLERLQSRFSQVVCISHLQAIKDLFDKRLTCSKHGGVTTVI
jgi:exonuclease SbcC